jgi:hypothetical protein
MGSGKGGLIVTESDLREQSDALLVAGPGDDAIDMGHKLALAVLSYLGAPSTKKK